MDAPWRPWRSAPCAPDAWKAARTPPRARPGVSRGAIRTALAHNDPARLVRPLTATRAHLRPETGGLAERIDALTRRTDELRQDTHDQRP
ncbi:hypothetical protein ABZT51_45455 [Streptomyces sp. NPDC005373]|uniref:hypothetical protein n=1 Tax=Streptomyces sp. NPDC005373 TaxID=3156879 RepID=UPI0033B65A7D